MGKWGFADTIRAFREKRQMMQSFSALWAVRKAMDDELDAMHIELEQAYQQRKQGMTPGSDVSKELLYQHKQEQRQNEQYIRGQYAEDLSRREQFIVDYLRVHDIHLQSMLDYTSSQKISFKEAVKLEKQRQDRACTHYHICKLIAAYRNMKPWHCMNCPHCTIEKN